jgi:DMSO reductase anchor subunit
MTFMVDPFTNPLPKSAYLRLLKHQQKTKRNAYAPDPPLVLFIFFSRVGAGLALVSSFFQESILWLAISLGCMILATLASIAHLSVPQRFLTMIRNNRSYLVWEIRLAGALTVCLGLEFLSLLGWFHGSRSTFPWINLALSILFLFSTGWAYRFETHPAWKTSLLPLYYLASGVAVGLAIRSTQTSSSVTPILFGGLLLVKAFLLVLYRNHLKTTSPTSLKKIVLDRERWTFLAFLWTDLFLPGLLTLALFIQGDFILFYCLFATSCLVAIFLERILFFWVERPIYFLSFIENPKLKEKYPYWIRG